MPTLLVCVRLNSSHVQMIEIGGVQSLCGPIAGYPVFGGKHLQCSVHQFSKAMENKISNPPLLQLLLCYN